MRTREEWLGAIPLVAVIGLVGCATGPEPPTHAEITNEVTAEAVVRGIEPSTREVTLERADGSRVSVVAGPEVRNFEQIIVGDTVQAHYVQSLAVRRLGPDEAGVEPIAAVAARRAEPGEAPAGSIAAGVAMTVRVESVDLEQHLVVFTDPEGRLHAVRAQRDEGQKFIAGLSPGDRVEMAFGEALILKVE